MKYIYRKIISKISTAKNILAGKFVIKKVQRLEHVGYEYIYRDQSASNLIINILNQNKPCVISRFGTTELSVVNYFIHNKKKYCKFPIHLKENISNLSGFFPNNDNALIRFCCESISCIKNIDAFGVRFDPKERDFFELEQKFITGFNKEAKLFEIDELSPFFVENPWTNYLRNKKVLVIHPFEKTILHQYNKRELLFKNPNILPTFELKTIKAVQSLADNKNNLPFDSWFDALDHMCNEIDKIEFDIAIIGAGAYGLFLADYCKKIGKKAIHMGGAVQVLFGIKGKRWDDLTEWNEKIYNENWKSPSDEEKPLNYKKVENGCYW